MEKIKFEDFPPEAQLEALANLRMWKQLLTLYSDAGFWQILEMFKKAMDETWAKKPSHFISKEQEAEKP
jgi:hypothetical protein